MGTGGTTYAISEDSYLYAWVSGSSQLWKHDLGFIPVDCLAVSQDGTVYVGLRNQDFAAVNARGARLWTVRLDGLPSGDPALAQDGTVLVGSSAGTLVALSHLGRRMWSVILPGAVTQSPVIDGAGTIYVVASDRRLYALTPWGEFKWSLPLAAAPGPLAITVDGSVVFGTDSGDVIAVSPGGEKLWQRPVGAPVIGLSTSEKEIVAATVPGLVVALAANGRELWRANAARALAAPPLIGAHGLLLSAVDGTILLLDDTHRISVSFKPKAPGGVTLAPDGAILVGGRDWVVYAVDPAALAAPGAPAAAPEARPAIAATATPGAVVGPWPQAGHDSMHSGRTEAAPPADNSGLLDLNPDYLYLQSLSGAGGREGIQLLLSEIGGRINSRTLGKSTWYAVRMLERIVGSGLLLQSRQNQRLINDFPDLRAMAAGLLARVGTIGTRATLLAVLDAEYDGVALAAEILALGSIASDGDGAAARAISRAFTRKASSAPDNRLAAAVVDALGRISVYEGALGEQSAVAALIAISRGPFDDGVRRDALSVLQGEPKVDIIDHEE